MNRAIIAAALTDALILRQETTRHDIGTELMNQLVVSAMPAFVTWEAEHSGEPVFTYKDWITLLNALKMLTPLNEAVSQHMTELEAKIKRVRTVMQYESRL
jgi:hypothetical protein